MRKRSSRHLAWIRERPCLICHTKQNIQAHHLLTGPEPRSMGLKASDPFAIPLCAEHHSLLHAWGNERTYLLAHFIEDPVEAANKLWARSPANPAHREERS